MFYTKRARLLVLTSDFPPQIWSGIGTAVANQVRALADYGLEVHVIVPESVYPMPADHGAHGFAIHSLSRRGIPVDPRRFNLLHLHSLALGELALEMKRRYGLPLIYTAHSLLDNELSAENDVGIWVAVQKIVMQVSDHVIFLNHAEQARAIEMIPHLSTRSSVIPQPIPVPDWRAPDWRAPDWRMQTSQTPGPVVFAGRFTRNKGISLLFEIIQQLSDRPGYNFVLAGGHADEFGEQIIRHIQAEYSPTCHLMGWLERQELDKLFSGAGLVLVPSFYEPFGMVALEAMRMGTPILAAAVGGLAEIVTPDSGGRLVYSHKAEEWSADIIALMEDRAENLRLRRQGPTYVYDHFNPERLAGRLMHEVYDRFLQTTWISAGDYPAWRQFV